jgi:hypothetical protein
MKSFAISLVISILSVLQLAAQTWNEEEQRTFAYNTMRRIAANDFDSVVVHFDSTMQRKLNSSILDRVYSRLLMQIGEYISHSEPRVSQADTLFKFVVPAKFKRAEAELTLTLNKSNQIAGLFLKPVRQTSEYLAPAYSDQLCVGEKKIDLKHGDISLPGILSVPCQNSKSPLVIFIHGSGPQDMDETIGPNKLFKDLNYQLIKKGIATYRFDKRTKSLPGFFLTKSDYTVQDEVIEDALQAVLMFKDNPLIDPQRIFLLGHSLGAMLGPRIALQSDLKGLIMMAGTLRPLEDVVLDQYRYLFNLDSSLNKEEQSIMETVKLQVLELKKLSAKSSEKNQKMLLDLPASYWLDLNQNPALKDFKKLRKPTLVLHAGRDYQINETDLNVIKVASKNRKNLEISVFKDLNHLFLSGKGPSKPEEYMEPGHVPTEVGDSISRWIQNQEGSLVK